MADQVVGQQNLRELCQELREDPEFDFYLLADSQENVDQLAEAAKNTASLNPSRSWLNWAFLEERQVAEM